MTAAIKLTCGSIIVDLTNSDTDVTLQLNNPFFVINIPKQDDAGNQIVIDLSMLEVQYNLTFTLKDGVGNFGTSDSTVTNGSVNFDKLSYMASTGIKRPCQLTFQWGTATTRVAIGNLRLTQAAGKKSIIDGTMTLQRVSTKTP